MISILLSQQGNPPIWGFSMIIYKTFDKYFSQIGANLTPDTNEKMYNPRTNKKNIFSILGGTVTSSSQMFNKSVIVN